MSVTASAGLPPVITTGDIDPSKSHPGDIVNEYTFLGYYRMKGLEGRVIQHRNLVVGESYKLYGKSLGKFVGRIEPESRFGDPKFHFEKFIVPGFFEYTKDLPGGGARSFRKDRKTRKARRNYRRSSRKN